MAILTLPRGQHVVLCHMQEHIHLQAKVNCSHCLSNFSHVVDAHLHICASMDLVGIIISIPIFASSLRACFRTHYVKHR